MEYIYDISTLSEACFEGQLEIVKYLISCSVDINTFPEKVFCYSSYRNNEIIDRKWS